MAATRSCPRLVLPLAALAVVWLLPCVPAPAVSIAWDVVPNAAPAINLYRNSHCTATAWMARHHGLRNSDETDQRLVATVWVYAQFCECDAPGQPILWRISEGLAQMFEARSRSVPSIRERCRTSPNASERASFADYVAAIDAGRPVIVTFCYDASAANGLAAAKRRESNCFSAVGIGYMRYDDREYLICRHGAGSGSEMGQAANDCVSAQALGINTAGKPWGEAGTSLFKWNGTSTNLVLVFVGW